MKKVIKHLREHKARIALTSEEKGALRANLVSFMKENPVGTVPSPFVGAPSPYVKRTPFAFNWRVLVPVRKFHLAPVALILALLLGSGLSAAAEETVPGDALYFIKTNVNESVKGWLALSPEAQVNLEAQIAETRLQEAEKLASERKLSLAVKTKLVSKFQTHANNFKEGVKTLESQGKTNTAASASSKFESSLNAHENVLLSLASTTPAEGNGPSLATSVAADVKTAAAAVSGVRVDLEAKVKTEGSASTTEATAQEAFRVAKENISDLGLSLTTAAVGAPADVLADAYNHLTLASTTLSAGNEKMKTNDFADAFILYQKAHRIAGEVSITLDAEKKLNIRVTSDFGDDITGSSTATTTATTTISGGGLIKGTTTEATTTSKLKLKI